jgi:hypothetical protein
MRADRLDERRMTTAREVFHCRSSVVSKENIQSTTLHLHSHRSHETEVSPDIEEATPIQFFYAIAKGDKVAGPFASDQVTVQKGKLQPKRGRAIASPWEAFDDPLAGFDDPRKLVVNWEEQYRSARRGAPGHLAG